MLLHPLVFGRLSPALETTPSNKFRPGRTHHRTMEPMRTPVFGWLSGSIFLCCAFLFAGCGSSDSGSGATSTQALSGKIGGKTWTFATGETDSYLSDGNTLFTTLYASTFAACNTFMPDTSAGTIIASLPRKTGSYGLSLSMNVTFYNPPGDNWVATRGSLEITEVTDTTISGGLTATYNGDNTADGRFTASICP